MNADGVPSPAAHDPGRNPHRANGHGKWAPTAIRSIIRNPRYTGFEVWNKQRKDEVLIDVDETYSGVVVEKMSLRKGQMQDMRPSGGGKVRLTFHIPSRGLMATTGSS